MASVTLQSGSQGVQVKELQKLLNQHGYNLAVDGIFGSKTNSAVRDFQQKNKLDVDGIVGLNTWSSLRGKSGNSTTPTQTNNDFKYDDFKYDDFKYGDFKYGDFKYDDFKHDQYQESDTVKQAQNALNAQLAQKPGAYQSQWQSQLNDVINKIMNREKFSYDLNGDALYQQYKDKYIKQGKMAMGDAIGQASAMTGGYGNSYAQSVGQQAYQAQLENLNDVVPELYQMAYDKYNQEGQDLYNQFSLLGSQEDRDYGRYRDSVGDWQSERDYLTGRYDSEREFDYSKYNNERDFAYSKYNNDRNFAYGQYADDRNFEYGQYADDRNFAYSKYSDDRSLAYDQYSDDKNLAYNEHRNAIEDEQWRKEFEEAKRQFDEKMALNDSSSGSSSGGSGSGSSGGSSGGSSQTTTNDRKPNATESTLTGNSGNNPNKNPSNVPKFTGKTYNDAVSFMESNGVPGGNVSGLMTASEWSSRRSSYQAFGQGDDAVKEFKTYGEYLKNYVEYAIETYGK